MGGTADLSPCTTRAEASECSVRGGICTPQSNDGCSNQCKLEATCGNDILEFREECDDGGTCIAGSGIGNSCTILTVSQDCGLSGICAPEDGDGCSATCEIEECNLIGDVSGIPEGYLLSIYNLGKHQDGMYNAATFVSPVDPRGLEWYDETYRTRLHIYTPKGPGNEIREIPFVGPLDNVPHDPSYFAAKWEGELIVPALGNYAFNFGSKDDSWVLIDGNVIASQRGIQSQVTNVRDEIILQPGRHVIEIYYASRSEECPAPEA